MATGRVYPVLRYSSDYVWEGKFKDACMEGGDPKRHVPVWEGGSKAV